VKELKGNKGEKDEFIGEIKKWHEELKREL
jgi:hypothetical protein